MKKQSMRYLLLFTIIGLSAINLALSQEITITGIISDDTGPLPGVNVVIKNTTRGSVSNFDGEYSIQAPSDAILQFSYIGYQTKEVAVNGNTSLDVTLTEDAQALDEVVVVGYGTQKKSDLTGAVSVVDVSEMNKQPTGQVSNQLQGQVSGVNIITSGQPGEDPLVTVRGFNTFGDNAPLYVVDGVPIDNINNLNPNDIASIQVLKDAGAASIYGSRASNGVLIITTRKGYGKIKLQYDTYTGMQLPRQGNVWNLLKPQGMANLKWMALRNGGTTEINDPLYGNGATPVLPDYIMPVGAMEGDPSVNPDLYYVEPEYTSVDQLNSFYRIVRANKSGTDWYHEIFKPAPITNHNIAVSGGGDQGSYLLSFNYLDQQGTLIKTYLKRYTLRSNAVFNVTEKIRVGENIGYSLAQNPVSNTNTEGSAIGMAFREQTIIPVRDIMGNYAGAFTTGGQLLGNARNPVAIQERTRNNLTRTNSLFGNVFGEIDLLDDLTFRSSFGGELTNIRGRAFAYPTYENPENVSTNTYSENSIKSSNWTWTNTLTYTKEIKSHSIKALVGIENYNEKSESLEATNQDYFIFDPNFTTISTGAGTPTANSERLEYSLSSYFGRLDYTFKDKYILSATLRRDGSSKFINNTWGWFPAASLGWRMSEENFMKGISWVSDLKVRGSWGAMGNQVNVNVLNSFSTYTGNRNSTFYDLTGGNSSLVLGYAQTSIGNPNAKWERNENINVGLDAGFWNGKLQLTADYYRKDIKDLLYNPSLPGVAGEATVPYINIASMKNSGLDASLNGNFGLGKDLRLSAMLTFTTYNNEIVSVSNLSDFFSSDPKRFGIDIIRNQAGHPVSSFYGYKIEGFWDDEAEIESANQVALQSSNGENTIYQNDVRVGHFRYADVNGDGRISDADRTFLGSPNPDFTYGTNIGLTYKNIDLSIFLFGSQGNEIWNQTKWWTDFYSTLGPGAKSYTALNESWTPERRNAKVAIQEPVASFGTSSVPNSYYVEDGSYLKIKNVQLGYSFPEDITDTINMKKLRVYLQAANILTFTKYSGIDPEISGGSTSFGIDEGSYMLPAQLIVGLNLEF